MCVCVWKTNFLTNQHLTDNNCNIWAKYGDLKSKDKQASFEEDPSNI